MKTIGLFFLALVLSHNIVMSQDSLRVYKSGQITLQRAVQDIDSIKFENKSNAATNHYDSLYVYKAGISVNKSATVDIDSLIFTKPAPLFAQIVYTSDLHYGISRTFRGGSSVDASVVNLAMINQINKVPAATFPADNGVNAGKPVGYVDYVAITGDITNKMNKAPTATVSWAKFNTDFLNGISTKNQKGLNSEFLLTCGNHDVSNAIGIFKTMTPATDNASMLNIYNLMMKPTPLKTTATYNYYNDKPNYSKDIAGVHLMFVVMWPDSANRIWMEKDLSNVSKTTPVLIFTHDPVACESSHFTNPIGDHSISDSYENQIEERYKSDVIEQRGWVAFVKIHPNIKAYFHGHSNDNEYYTFTGPDGGINLKIYRVDSPMKGSISGNDETKLSFQVLAIDGNTKTLTVRECLWNTSGAASAIVWGTNSTISLK
ncbi:MAG: metallophosphoesterase [Paludibacter sp.]